MEVGSIWPKSSCPSWLDSASPTACQAWISLPSKCMPGKQNEIKHRSESIGVLPLRMLVSNSSVSILLLNEKSETPTIQMKSNGVLGWKRSIATQREREKSLLCQRELSMRYKSTITVMWISSSLNRSHNQSHRRVKCLCVCTRQALTRSIGNCVRAL